MHHVNLLFFVISIFPGKYTCTYNFFFFTVLPIQFCFKVWELLDLTDKCESVFMNVLEMWGLKGNVFSLNKDGLHYNPQRVSVSQHTIFYNYHSLSDMIHWKKDKETVCVHGLRWRYCWALPHHCLRHVSVDIRGQRSDRSAHLLKIGILGFECMSSSICPSTEW